MGEKPSVVPKGFLIAVETVQTLRESYSVGAAFSDIKHSFNFIMTCPTFQQFIGLSKS
jgi:hypothetical protein